MAKKAKVSTVSMPLDMIMTSVQLQPISEANVEFLRDLYASTRAEEMAIVPWTQAQRREFLNQQFSAQHQYYQQQFPNAKFNLILFGDLPIGRLYVESREDEIRVIDISLTPEYRRAGIGGVLMSNVLDQARKESKAVRIHVEHNNPAVHLYLRLGFKPIDSDGIYHLMEWDDDEQNQSE